MHTKFFHPTLSGKVLWIVVFQILFCVLVSEKARAAQNASYKFRVLTKSASQDDGSWDIYFRARYIDDYPLDLTPEAISADVEAWVSNSAAEYHSSPRFSKVHIPGSGETLPLALVVLKDGAKPCVETFHFEYWLEGEGTAQNPPLNYLGRRIYQKNQTVRLQPGAILGIKMRIEHQHDVYGAYNPLLGARTFAFSIDAAEIFHEVMENMLEERYQAYPKYSWPLPPEERRSDRYFRSAPDSLYFGAHISNEFSYYFFPDRPVRYRTKMKLSFWYLIAIGTEGEPTVKTMEFKDSSDSARKILSEGAWTDYLKTIGRWKKFEHVFVTQPEATTLSLAIRLESGNVGEMWVDDLSLVTLEERPNNP